MDVAFLGLGRMGAAMAAHVLSGGHALTVWNRTPGRAGELVERGARGADTPAQAVAGADVVVLMLFGPAAVDEVLNGPDGVIAGAGPGTLVIDATTVGPDFARATAARLAERGLRYVDAPVAGAVGPAREGTLGVFAGGADDDVARARPLLEAWGDPARVQHLGPVGAGSALKLVVNLALAHTAEGLGEALRLAADLGVDRDGALRALGSGPYGWLLDQKGAMVESGDYNDVAFSLDLMRKDVDLAVSTGSRDLPAARASLASLVAAAAAGSGGGDYAALVGAVEQDGEPSEAVRVVDTALAAYNAQDLDGFCAVHADDVTVENLSRGGGPLAGVDAVRTTYEGLFAANPRLHATVVGRSSVGDWVVDEQVVSGYESGPDPRRALVSYRVQAGRITAVRLMT